MYDAEVVQDIIATEENCFFNDHTNKLENKQSHSHNNPNEQNLNIILIQTFLSVRVIKSLALYNIFLTFYCFLCLPPFFIFLYVGLSCDIMVVEQIMNLDANFVGLCTGDS